ncbi:MAG: anaerobic sulfatase maturase [Planctomycetota bacterium]|jgi:uncharacterized protein
MKAFSLLIKPAGADCNLRCEYCFYLEKAALYPDTPRPRMSDEVLEKIVKSYLASEQSTHIFGWQGGEPTLMGADFFRKVTDLQQKFGKRGAVVANGLQTNGLLIDDAFASHLGEYRFLLGLSLDGPREIHDRNRRSKGGKGSHGAVLQAAERLKRNHVQFNILVLVSQANVKEAKKVYRFLRDQGFHHHQYIPCVEFDEEGRRAPLAITGKAWGDFLCELFDAWHDRDIDRVSIRHFDAVLARLVKGATEICTMGKDCRQYFLIEHNGDIYPCDFFADPAWKLGNIMETSWEEVLRSELYRRFGEQKSRWDARCDECPHLDLCAGDCLKHRGDGGKNPMTRSWLCEGWKRFYNHTRKRFETLAAKVRSPQRR